MIDLHAHTTCSDGSVTPTQLVELAARLELAAVAITDHDSIEGVDEAVAAGRRLGIEVVPGVEIPLEFETFTLDMLGYFLCGPPSDEFRRRLVKLRQGRDERNAQILARLRETGIDLDPAELADVAAGEAVGRLGLPEALRLIRASGGVAAIAHPGLIRTDHAGLERLLRESVRHGLSGLECYYPRHDDQTVRFFLDLAREHGLVATGGSDYHGDIKPDVRLGVVWQGRAVADEVLDQLKARCEQPGE